MVVVLSSPSLPRKVMPLELLVLPLRRNFCWRGGFRGGGPPLSARVKFTPAAANTLPDAAHVELPAAAPPLGLSPRAVCHAAFAASRT